MSSCASGQIPHPQETSSSWDGARPVHGEQEGRAAARGGAQRGICIPALPGDEVTFPVHCSVQALQVNEHC